MDANEGWTTETYQQLVPELYSLAVKMIEQPLPAGQDDALKTLDRPIPLCADESCHASASLIDIIGKYDMINIKLDKTGGLTEDLALKQVAQVVDHDSRLLLQKDRDQGMLFDNGLILPATPALWG